MGSDVASSVGCCFMSKRKLVRLGFWLYWLLWTSVQIIASRRTVDQASTHCRSRGNQDTIRKWKHVLTLPHAQQLIFAKEKLIL
jgi:hypothetical protein